MLHILQVLSIFLYIYNKQPMEIRVPSFYDIAINDIHGHKMDLSQFKGKKILIVNVASECGYTPQYTQLQELYDSHKEHLVILGCPSNDFGGQEPGKSEEIVTFCQKNYGVTFPLTEKLGITEDTHALYQWLCKKELNGVEDHVVKWNFNKFLVDEQGKLLAYFPSGTSPLDEQIASLIH